MSGANAVVAPIGSIAVMDTMSDIGRAPRRREPLVEEDSTWKVVDWSGSQRAGTGNGVLAIGAKPPRPSSAGHFRTHIRLFSGPSAESDDVVGGIEERLRDVITLADQHHLERCRIGVS